MSLPLEGLPKGTTDLRISTNQEIYWDRIFVAWAEDCPEAKRTELPLAEARLAECGFSRRTTLAQHRPHYDYQKRSPQWDTRHLAGWYTRLGPVEELLAKADDAVVVFGPGEEVQMEFADRLPELARDWTRQLVLEQHGWCKDMDLYTKDGETVGPLPQRGGVSTAAEKAARDALHRRYNTRYRAGAD
jgi:hypothetical protein